MKIYSAQVDVERYQSIGLNDESLWGTDQMDFDCRRKEAMWDPPEVHIMNPKEQAGDFYYLTPGALVFNQAALDALIDMFEMAGEILPLRREDGGELYLLNVLECPNALDHKKTEWNISPTSGRPTGTARRYAFHGNRLFESTLFKVPEMARGYVLTYAGVKDPEDEFKSRYEASGLTGLEFEELWEG